MTVNLRVRTVIDGWTGGPGLMTVYWRPGTGGGTTADATDCVARVRACLFATLLQFPSPVTFAVQSQVDAIEDTTGALVGSFSATPVALVSAGGANSFAPTSSMYLVRLRTALVVNNRILRGRVFLGPILSTQVTSAGGISAGAQTSLNNAFTAMLTGGTTASFPVVWHRPGTTVGTSGAIVAVSTWAQLGVLRSRRD